MDTLFLYNTKTLKEKFKTKVFAGDNYITKIAVQIPDNIGGYPKRECEFNLRAIIPEGNLSYMIDPLQPYFYITNDITEKAQIVKLMMIITHEGNVIGRTNTVDLIVNEPAEAPDPPLTPREEFDEVIAEQRAEIAEQAETINSQASQIEQDTETISGLNTQVSELTTENEQLETQHTADQNTIQYLIENPPEARLQPKSVTPTAQMQVVKPDEGYQGLSTVAVGAVTPPRLQAKEVTPQSETQFIEANDDYDGLSAVTVLGYKYINPDLQTWLARGAIGSIEIQSNEIGDYLCYNQAGIVNCILSGNPTSIGNNAFRKCTGLTEFIIPEGVTHIGDYAFSGLSSLISLKIPSTLTSLGTLIFQGSSNLQYVTIGNGFNANNLNLSASTLYSVETIVSWLEALAGRTGQKAYTLTIGTTNLNKLTNEQKAIATNKNWNLA